MRLKQSGGRPTLVQGIAAELKRKFEVLTASSSSAAGSSSATGATSAAASLRPRALGVSKALGAKRFRPRFDPRAVGFVIRDGASKRQQHAALKTQAIFDKCHNPQVSTIDNNANR